MSATGEQRRERIDPRRIVLQMAATMLILVALLFLPAWTWRWVAGWVFLGVFAAACALSGVYVWLVNPDVVAARSNPHSGTKGWDKVLLGFITLVMAAILPVAALDERFGWFPLPWWVCALGYVPFLAGWAFMTWATAVNKFFEPTVRLQADRGQRVIDVGPYALVRHPGYLSCLPLFVGIAVSLGSLWALVPAALSCLILLLRTRWEDQTLQAELPGYAEYARRVRYRLIPGVW
jgi:protein-S-isoprenylcysteine O-methyltransferase Ste14